MQHRTYPRRGTLREGDTPPYPIIPPTQTLPPTAPASPPMPHKGAPAQPWGEGLPPNLHYPWDPQQQTKPARRLRLGKILLLALAALLVVVGLRLTVFVLAISTEPLWGAHFWPLTATQQANVLVLGYGGQGHEGAYLTDSMLLIHSDLPQGRTTQIAVPRDLWVQIPPDSGQYAKINSAYAYGRGETNNELAGGRLATTKVSQVTGLSTDRWVTIDFQGFRALVDALGGVDIEVEHPFTSRYPANDNPEIDPSWIEISFAAGKQHMDGETAMRYARARYATDPIEGSDFARGQRQARLMAAISAKLKSPSGIIRAFSVMNALQPVLRTNLAPVDLLILAVKANTGASTRIRLDDTNVLVNETSADGQAILVPPGRDYGVISRYIAEQLNDH